MAKSPRRRTRDTSADEPARVEPEVEVADEPTGKRIGIQLDADGRIAWDRLRASTRDELKNMIADPRLAEELGSAPRVNGDALDPSTVGMLYGALGSLMVGAAKAMGYPEDQALSMQFTADERDALLTPTSKVLQKYTGALGAWEDEIMLSFALGSILIAKVSALKKPAKVIKMAERTSSPAPDPDPVTM